MGMQIVSLSMGNGAAAAVPKLPTEMKMSLSAEHKAALKQFEASLPGNWQPPPPPDLKQTATDLEHVSLAFNRRLKFIIDQESREILIKVIDNETDKVIKVLPPEELQRLHSRIKETIGFLFDKMV